MVYMSYPVSFLTNYKIHKSLCSPEGTILTNFNNNCDAHYSKKTEAVAYIILCVKIRNVCLPFRSLPRHAVVCFSAVALIGILHILRYQDFFGNMANNTESKIIT